MRSEPVRDRRSCEGAGYRQGPGLAGRERRRLFQAELQFRRPALSQRLAKGAAQDLVHERLLEEPYFRLRRVNVDVHPIRRDAEEQMDLRTALLDAGHAVGLDNRLRDRAILDDAAVDEDVLRAAGRSLVA